MSNSRDDLLNELPEVEEVVSGALLFKVLGPVTGEVGKDLAKGYQYGRDKILEKAFNKIDPHSNSNKKANLRVARDVLWNGSFAESEIASEYFGGILAASRSETGEDDRGVFYTDIIKSLSSQQLLLHYIIYRGLNNMFVNTPDINSSNVSLEAQTHLNSYPICFHKEFLESKYSWDLGESVVGLSQKNLVGVYESDIKKIEVKGIEYWLPYFWFTPTPLGIQLYAISHNKFDEWREFSNTDFGSFSGITLPQFYEFSLENLRKRVEEVLEDTA